jgi:dUTP pyrophosphatase
MVTIYAHKNTDKAVIPTVAYNSTSACFDITCTETTVIPAGKSAVVPNGLNLTIPDSQRYYMRIDLRSSMGFKKDLSCFPGIIDPGYTGDLSVKVYNIGETDITIEEGERYAQISVIPIPESEIIELNDEEFNIFKITQLRGDKGFGSSGKN